MLSEKTRMGRDADGSGQHWIPGDRVLPPIIHPGGSFLHLALDASQVRGLLAVAANTSLYFVLTVTIL